MCGQLDYFYPNDHSDNEMQSRCTSPVAAVVTQTDVLKVLESSYLSPTYGQHLARSDGGRTRPTSPGDGGNTKEEHREKSKPVSSPSQAGGMPVASPQPNLANYGRRYSLEAVLFHIPRRTLYYKDIRRLGPS